MDGWIYVHHIDPILFRLGPLRIGWYGIMYAISFLTGYWFLLRVSRAPDSPLPESEVPNLLTYLILGVVVGGRLGWVIFYGGLPYFEQPWRILQTWKGGMSFHGGLIGVILALLLYARRHNTSVVRLSDHIILWVPVGLFLGRIGNFINGELYGKPTDGSWGVIFPTDPQRLPRQPSQLYEAVLEGLVIFLVLAAMRWRVRRKGLQTAMFLTLYGIARIAVEFVRLPDANIGYLAWGWVTEGQVLSLPVLLFGLGWVIYVLAHPETALPEPKPKRK